MSLLEQDIIRKGQVDVTTSRLEFESSGDSEEYEIKVICDNAVYARESEGHLPKPLLFDLMEKIPRGKKYLGACFSGITPPQTH